MAKLEFNNLTGHVVRVETDSDTFHFPIGEGIVRETLSENFTVYADTNNPSFLFVSSVTNENVGRIYIVASENGATLETFPSEYQLLESGFIVGLSIFAVVVMMRIVKTLGYHNQDI